MFLNNVAKIIIIIVYTITKEIIYISDIFIKYMYNLKNKIV